ncbi:MAG: protein kinase domain-containing protein, partial [Gemmataceae bacterium]
DNLMLNEQGVVKVADLGLVRTPGLEEKPAEEVAGVSSAVGLASLSGVTLAGQAMGTPSYMAPEQARDATSVDQRADVYSLGCTLYVMITGRPVFEGKTALEVMTRHAADPVPRPELVVKDVPRALSDIVVKMIAKKPDDRYPTMDDSIKALEAFLGLQAGKAATTEQHLRVLESGVKAFNASSLANVRGLALLGFFGGCLLLSVLMLFTRWWAYGSFFLALGGSAAASYFVVRGSAERGYLFRRVRDALLSSPWVDLLKLAGAALVATLVLFFLGLLWLWLLGVALGVGVAFGLHLGLDKRIAADRAEPLDKVERMLKTLRLRGLSEEALQEFVGQFAGDRWEEFFEALFGYEAKLAARARHAGKPRAKFAAWREPVLAWIDRVQKGRQEARERAHLQKVEQKCLEAQGVSAGEAKERAERVAVAMVAKAAEIKQAVIVPEATVAPEAGQLTAPDAKKAPPQRVNVQDLFQVADVPQKPRRVPAFRVGDLLALPFGGGARLLVGGFLLVAALFWAWSNGLIPGGDKLEEGGVWLKKFAEAKEKAGAVRVPGVPEEVRKGLFSVGALAAGFLVLSSSLWRSWKIGVMQYLAAAVMIAGPLSGYVPAVGPLGPVDVCLAAGVALSALGFVFGRDT